MLLILVQSKLRSLFPPGDPFIYEADIQTEGTEGPLPQQI